MNIFKALSRDSGIFPDGYGDGLVMGCGCGFGGGGGGGYRGGDGYGTGSAA